MKIRAMAGRLALPAWADFRRFAEYLRALASDDLGDGTARHLYVRPDRDVTYALNLLVKDQKRFYQWAQTDGRPTLRVAETDNMVEFNYAYFRNDNGAFVFTHYRGSGTGIAEFGAMLKRRFRTYAQDTEASEGRKLAKRAEFRRLMSREAWQAKLRGLRRVKAFSVEVVGESDGLFEDADLKSILKEYRFDPVSRIRKIKDGILAAAEQIQFRRARVRGRDDEDGDVTIVLGDNVEILEEFDYDTAVEEMGLDDFHTRPLMRSILAFRDHAVLRARS